MIDERGSGRTHRQIESMRPGDIFIVGSIGMMQYAQTIAQKIGMQNLKVWVAPDPYKLMGLHPDVHIVVDHDYAESEQLKRVVHAQNSKVPR